MTKQEFIGEVRQCLTRNILPYWIENMVDPRGGFHGRRDGDDQLHADAPKGAILNARILWTFSAAYRVLGDKAYLEMATRAKREVIDRFYDHKYGGVFWSIAPDGTPLDTKKQFYALGFAIYGLSEYARATGDAEALDYAVRLFRDIEAHSRDRVHGGYTEALDRFWNPLEDMRLSAKDANVAKTMNTHLHIIEPYTNLLRVWRDADLLEATEALQRLFIDRIVASGERGHLGLFFLDDWTRTDDIVSYGHDIEASWLLLETAQVLGDESLLAETLAVTRRIAHAAFEGRLPDGSMIYEAHGDRHLDSDRHWWVQAENIIGEAYLFLYHNEPGMLDRAMESWTYTRDNIIDHERGEWYWSRKDTAINRTDDKAGFWKCPYHNSRMCLELIEKLG